MKQELRKRHIIRLFLHLGVSRKFMQEQLIKQDCSEKINQRDITWKLKKLEQSFLCMACCPDLKHIPVKLHEDISNHYRVMAQTRIFGKKLKKGE